MSRLTVKHEDKNGVKLQAGQIVKISNSYFKCDNGYYFIEHEPEAPTWCGDDYGLKRINSRTGELSTGRNTCAFYPLASFCSDQRKNRAADEWNEEHSEIEVITTIKNDAVVEFFKNVLARKEELKKSDSWFYGEDHDLVKKDNIAIDYYKEVLERITATEEKEIEEPTQEETTTEAPELETEQETEKKDDFLDILQEFECKLFYAKDNESNSAKDEAHEAIKKALETYYNATHKAEDNQPTPPDEPTKAEKSAEVEQEPTAEPATAEIVPTYYPINEQTARTAQNMNSFTEYKAGSATETYKTEINEVYAIAEEIAQKRPEQAEKAAYMANKYAKKLADYYNAYYHNEASCPSVLICGAGNFPTRKKEKQNSRRDSLMKEWKELESYKEKIKSILTHKQIIKSGDADAVEQLKAKIEKLEQAQALYKATNKAIRKNDNESLKKLGFTDAQIDELKKPDFCGRVGYPSYVLQNNNANIKRLKSRLADIERAKATETTEETAAGADGSELFQIVRNTEAMRLQLIFDGKPDEETRNILKNNGFRWSPSAKAWQRLLNNNSEYALKRVQEKLAM